MKHVRRFLNILRTAISGSADRQFFCTETGCAQINIKSRPVSDSIPAHERCINISNCRI
jgi:hypothetical protein